MDDHDTSARNDEVGSVRLPWSAPKVILADTVASGIAVDNKGQFNIPDRKSSSTSTS
jgi:hypothetical protein